MTRIPDFFSQLTFFPDILLCGLFPRFSRFFTENFPIFTKMPMRGLRYTSTHFLIAFLLWEWQMFNELRQPYCRLLRVSFCLFYFTHFLLFLLNTFILLCQRQSMKILPALLPIYIPNIFSIGKLNWIYLHFSNAIVLHSVCIWMCRLVFVLISFVFNTQHNKIEVYWWSMQPTEGFQVIFSFCLIHLFFKRCIDVFLPISSLPIIVFSLLRFRLDSCKYEFEMQSTTFFSTASNLHTNAYTFSQ